MYGLPTFTEFVRKLMFTACVFLHFCVKIIYIRNVNKHVSGNTRWELCSYQKKSPILLTPSYTKMPVGVRPSAYSPPSLPCGRTSTHLFLTHLNFSVTQKPILVLIKHTHAPWQSAYLLRKVPATCICWEKKSLLEKGSFPWGNKSRHHGEFSQQKYRSLHHLKPRPLYLAAQLKKKGENYQNRRLPRDLCWRLVLVLRETLSE